MIFLIFDKIFQMFVKVPFFRELFTLGLKCFFSHFKAFLGITFDLRQK